MTARRARRVPLREARRALWAPTQREALVAYQGRRLRELVRHAYQNVPFYRRAFDRAGVSPRDVRGLEDLAALPIVSKEDMRPVPLADRIAEGTHPDSLVTLRTSGSTGRPFAIHRTLGESRLLYLFRMRALRGYGTRLRDRNITVAEPPLGRSKRLGMMWHLQRRLGIYRHDLVSCFQEPEAIASELARARPDSLSGYPGALARVADRVAAGHYPGIRPRFIFTGGEPLLPEARSRIERGFDTRVFDVFASVEFHLMASECPRGGPLHVCDDAVILEVIRDGKPVAEGERGEVVVTGLHVGSVPLIRYRMRDIVRRGAQTCACGQPFSTLSKVQGRAAHYLKVPGVGLMHPFELTGPLIEHESDWIDQYQLEQESEHQLRLRVTPLRPPSREAVERLEARARKTLGGGMCFRVELVDLLPPDSSGKFRPYVSLLPGAPPEFDGAGDLASGVAP